MTLLPHLDRLNLDEPITSDEGLDVNYTSRIRSQYLIAQSTVLVTQTQFADAKATALMTLSGLLMFRGPVRLGSDMTGDPLLLLSLGFNLACLVSCILAVIPRIRAAPQDASFYGVERFSWIALSLPADDDPPYSEFMRTAQVSQLIMSQARANQASAHVLRKKFRILRIAFLLGLATILAIALQWIVTAPIG